MSNADTFVKDWLSSVQNIIKESNQNLTWVYPHIAGDEDEISLEWWKGQRNITVFIRNFQIEILKIWGSNIHDEMEESCMADISEFVELWKWLEGKEDK